MYGKATADRIFWNFSGLYLLNISKFFFFAITLHCCTMLFKGDTLCWLVRKTSRFNILKTTFGSMRSRLANCIFPFSHKNYSREKKYLVRYYGIRFLLPLVIKVYSNIVTNLPRHRLVCQVYMVSGELARF